MLTIKPMENTSSDHETIFNQICNQLNDLSPGTKPPVQEVIAKAAASPKIEMMQNQMKKFNTDMIESQEELKSKIKNLGNVQFGYDSMDQQLRQLSEQLTVERGLNSKLSADLARSLEVSLQLQLEIQNLKTRTGQSLTEEKKYSLTLQDKLKNLHRDFELSQALKDESALELAKAKNAFQRESQNFEGRIKNLEETLMKQREEFTQSKNTLEDELKSEKESKVQLENKLLAQIEGLQIELESVKTQSHETLERTKSQHDTEMQETVEFFEKQVDQKDEEIKTLNSKIEEIQCAFTEVEGSAQQQQEVLNNLMSVAESKIVEMKLALDKKAIEAQDYYSHLQQALTQLQVTKQENISLRDYAQKLNYYHQQTLQQAGIHLNQQATTQQQQQQHGIKS